MNCFLMKLGHVLVREADVSERPLGTRVDQLGNTHVVGVASVTWFYNFYRRFAVNPTTCP